MLEFKIAVPLYMIEASESPPAPCNLRLNARRLLPGSARLLDHDAVPRTITVTDISKGGMGIVVCEPMQIGDPCAIAMDVSVAKEIKRINVWAKVAYCRSQGTHEFKIGVRFLDYDSYSKMYIEQLCNTGSIQAGW